jgi:pyruvate,orthophosphate dikinase
MENYVYIFANGRADGSADMKELLGGKGAGLAEMTNVGLPVPPGFTIATTACTAYYAHQRQFPVGMWGQALAALRQLETTTGRGFGSPTNPLLVSVRSGAKFSMPGMMDTILNLGLSNFTLKGVASLTNDPRFAYDSYRRFIQMFGKIVLNIEGEKFDHIFQGYKKAAGATSDTELTAPLLAEICQEFQQLVLQETGQPFPQDPYQQLEQAIHAVFASWNGKRAVDYRRVHKIPDNLGTAVNVVAMVFGNMGNDCGTGVAFTRNPATGDKELYGEYLANAQGEDVVAGIRTPKKIAQLQQDMPEVYDQFVRVAEILEKHYHDVEDLEFTVEQGKLWMLQTRNAKRTGRAAIKIAVDLAKEGLIDQATAVMRVEPKQLDQLLHPMLDPQATTQLLALGLPASPGAATGKVVFSADEAEQQAQAGEKVILVRIETSPEDFHGMVASQAILTARGGMTSHAAVVARGMGKCCVVGCDALQIDYARRQFVVGQYTINQGDYITLDGSTGQVLLGQVPVIAPQVDDYFREFMQWVDQYRQLRVRTNADTPRDAAVAREFGAEGIGLCRTEHMFFEGDRIDVVREMILANTRQEREQALSKLEVLQQQDFLGIFQAMNGYPVTIRMLDPPLHEFLPHGESEIAALAAKLGVSAASLAAKVASLHESNPMLGHRGCRLGIVYPEITAMQARALFRAAVDATNQGIAVFPEVMIPLVSDVRELQLQATLVQEIAQQVFVQTNTAVEYLIGTMIELPRAALTANQIATVAQFFSFGTNDLTQTTFGLSRDDSGRFLPFYLENKIYREDPFQVLDQEGVGRLIDLAVTLGRQTRPDLKLGICGEHGGDPKSVIFCHHLGLNYVSCSPYRVPIARLAAAQAALGSINYGLNAL